MTIPGIKKSQLFTAARASTAWTIVNTNILTVTRKIQSSLYSRITIQLGKYNTKPKYTGKKQNVKVNQFSNHAKWAETQQCKKK